MYSKKIAFPVVVGLVLSVAIIMPNGNPSSKVDAIGREMNLGTQPAVLVKVNSTLLPQINSSLQNYKADLSREGYKVYIQGFNENNEHQLRSEIKELYDSDGKLIGCLFIGNLPLAWTHSNWPDGPDLPTDYYFMDLDGKWIDEDNDGVYDHHTFTSSGDSGPEIWVGRLYPSTIAFDNYNEKTLIQDYFDRNHLYRTGHLNWEGNEVPLYFTNCPEGAEPSELSALNSLDKYPDAELHECYMDPFAGFTLRSELREGHEFVHVTSHGYETGFYMENSFDVTSAHIWRIKPHTLFYIGASCSTGRFIITNYLGGSAIFSTGLVYLGATGWMCYFPEHNNIFVGNLNNHTFGYSYKSVYDSIYSNNPNQDIYWSNMEWVLLGDPTLKLNMSEYFTNDTTPPTVTITSPKEGFLYFRNRMITPFFTTMIIGKIEIEVDAFDNESGIDRVEFYIDNVLKETLTSEPYSWMWDEMTFFKHTIKVIAYDKAGNTASDEIDVIIFNI